MRQGGRLLLAALIAPTALAGEIQVRVNGGLVDMVAIAAPLQDVLARLAQQTGMKVVYDGTLPRPLITVTLPQRTPAESVLALLEGLGLNYALRTDVSGTKVDTLILSGAPGTVTSGSVQPVRDATALPTAPDPRRPMPRPAAVVESQEGREEEVQADEAAPKPQIPPTPPGPVNFSGPSPGPGQAGSPFGGQIGPLTMPTPPPAPTMSPAPPAPVPSPTPSPGA